MFALVAWPALATAPSAQTDDILSESDNYIVSIYVSELSSISSEVSGFDPNSCVSYAKYKRPDQNFQWVAPKYVEAYDIEPFEGALVLTTESRPGTDTGHVAYVESITDATLTVSEANWVTGLVTRRSIPRNAPFIRGYR